MQAPDHGWGTAIIVVPFAVGLCLSAVFVVRELRQDDPLINMRLFTNSTFGSGVSIIFFAQFMKVCAFVFGALCFQKKLGMSPFMAGLAILPAVALQPFLAASTGNLIDRLGTRRPSIWGCMMAFVSLVWFTAVIPYSNYWLVLPAFLVWSLAAPVLFMAPSAWRSPAPSSPAQAAIRVYSWLYRCWPGRLSFMPGPVSGSRPLRRPTCHRRTDAQIALPMIKDALLYAAFLTARTALVPPNANELLMAVFMSRFLATLGVTSRSHSGSGSS